MNLDRKAHWEDVYKCKPPDTVSWYQADPAVSLDLIRHTRIPHDAAIIDVGGGTSMLVDRLTDQGYTNLTVLDISENALDVAKTRLGAAAHDVRWIECDITGFSATVKYALWHDRAVFHFLTERADRRKYVSVLRNALNPGSHAIIATFAKDGPTQCSGLNIVQYDAGGIAAEFGNAFRLVDTKHEAHITPARHTQNFQYFLFERTNQK